jgi:methylglutaconyl-CoA hydratase
MRGARGGAMPGQDFTKVSQRGAARWIELDSPANRNALSEGLVRELLAHLEAAMADEAARVVVLTGRGPAFCAGADLKSRGAGIGRAGDEQSPFVRVLKLLWDGPKPVVAGVNGHAFGGGIGLAAACDVAVGASSARFSFSEVRIGLVPATISVVVIPKLGVSQTLKLFLSGERFDAARAQELGLLHRVVAPEELARALEEEVEAIAQGGPLAIREAKRLVRTVAALPMEQGFAYAQALITRLFDSPEADEGRAAFAEKRPPRWLAGR